MTDPRQPRRLLPLVALALFFWLVFLPLFVRALQWGLGLG